MQVNCRLVQNRSANFMRETYAGTLGRWWDSMRSLGTN